MDLFQINQKLEALVASRTAELTDEKDRLKLIAATVPGVIFSVCRQQDNSLSFEYVGPGLSQLFGEVARELPRSFDELLRFVHPADVRRVARSVSRSGMVRSVWRGEFRINRSDREAWAEVCAAPTRHPDGTLWWHGYASDISDRKRQEIESKRMRAEAEERKITHLEQLVSQQRALTHSFIRLLEEERRAVAYELHDGLTQYVMSAHLFLDTFASRYGTKIASARPELDKGLECLEQAVSESRRLVNGLRALSLDDMGLAGAMEQLLNDETTLAGWTETSFVHNIAYKRFAVEIETAVFRIAQEALVNARKHSGTSRIDLQLMEGTLASGGIELTLTIRDWGSGFRGELTPTEYGHLGMRSMRERTALMDGALSIVTAIDNGTTICVKIPVR